MNPSEMNAYTASNNIWPFYIPMPPFPSPLFQNPVLQNPFYVPGRVFGNGSLCFPYFTLSDYPASPLLQYPLTTSSDQRPVVPMSSHIGQIQPSNVFGVRKQTIETQTGPEQARNTCASQETYTQAISHDIGNMTSIPSAVVTDSKNISGKTEASSVAPERCLHGVRPDNSIPLTCAASEEKKVRVERSSGSPARAFWMAFKESVRLYDLAYENMREEVQPDVIAQHYCENQGVLCHLPEGEDITKIDEQRGVRLWEQHLEVEDVKSGDGVEVRLGQIKNGCGTAPQILPTTNKAKGELQLAKSQNNVMEKEYKSRAVSQLQQEKQLCSSMEVGDLSAQKNLREKKRDPGSPENYCPSPTGLAQCRKVITVIQQDVRATEKQHILACEEPKVCEDKECLEYKLQANNEGHGKSKLGGMCPVSSSYSYNYYQERTNSKVSEPVSFSMKCSEKPQEEKPLVSDSYLESDIDEEFYEEEDDIEMDNEYEERIDIPSPNLHFLHENNQKERATSQVDIGIQCDRSRPKKQRCIEVMYCRPDCDSDSLSTYLENREEIVVVETSASETVCSPPPVPAQSSGMITNENYFSAFERAHAAAVAGQSLNEESWPNSPVTVWSLRSIKSSPKEKTKNRTYKTDEMVKDNIEEDSDYLTSSPKMKKNVKSGETKAIALSPNRRAICMLKRHPRFNILAEDLEDSKDDEVYEVEGLFQEVHGQDTLIFHKGRIYQEIGRAKPFKSEGPIPPLLSVRCAGKRGDLKLGVCESIPKPHRLKMEEGFETVYVGCQKKLTTAKLEESESETDSTGSWRSYEEFY